MDRPAYDALVRRLESLARDRPAAYQRRVLALGWLGYAFLGVLVTLLLALTIAALASVAVLKAAGIKLALIAGGFLYAVARALVVRLEPPQGEPLRRADAPEFYALLDGLRARLDTPRIDAVLVTPEFNAAVAQTPRLGLFGWHRNTLIVGVALMQSLSVAQFESVLAHELGHLSRGHARAANWIYRLRLIWARLEAALAETPRFGDGLVRRFYRWYVPYFGAYSFPLARANEYEADAAAARLTSPRVAAEALTAVNVVGEYLGERFWPGVFAGAKDTPAPAFAPYSRLGSQLREVAALPELSRWLSQAMTRRTSTGDTHPALVDRLAALGEAPRIALPGEGESADRLLGARRAALLATFDAEWRERVGPAWAERHGQLQHQREVLEALRARVREASTPPEADLLLELAELEESVGDGPAAALAVRAAARERFPESREALVAWAMQRLRDDDPEAARLLEPLALADPARWLGIVGALHEHALRRGDAAAAQRWAALQSDGIDVRDAAQAERAQLNLADGFQAHELPAAQLESLRAALRGIPGLRRGWLVQKTLRHFPDVPLYVFAWRCTPWYLWHRAAREAEVAAQLREAVQWPGETFLLCVDTGHRSFQHRLAKIGTSRVV